MHDETPRRPDDQVGARSRDSCRRRLPRPLYPARTFTGFRHESNRSSPGPEFPMWEQLELPRLTQAVDKGPGDARPLSFCPEARIPHIQNRIGKPIRRGGHAPAREPHPRGRMDRQPAVSKDGQGDEPTWFESQALLRAAVCSAEGAAGFQSHGRKSSAPGGTSRP